MKRASSVLVIGSANTDLSIKLDRLPQAGETILGGDFITASGGKGANQAVAAARAGADVAFIGRVGRDAFGDTTMANLGADGINVEHVIRDPASPSGVALILVGRAGENCIAVAPGANGKLSQSDLLNARKAFVGARVVVLQLEVPMKTVEMGAALAVEAGAKVVLNPAPGHPLPPELLRRVFVLTPNESETELLTGMKLKNDSDVAKAAAKLQAGGAQNIVITLGSRGVYIAEPSGCHWVKGFKVEAVDATAAGDVFNGVLSACLAEGKTLVDSAHLANAAAAVSVTRPGAQPSAPTRAEIEQMLASRQPLRTNGHAHPARKRPTGIQA
jgi:ribokinase